MHNRVDRLALCLRWPALSALLAFLAIGCSEDTSIRVYQVAKTERAGSAVMASSDVAVEKKMLGAIVPNVRDVWFFKLTGAPAKVDSVAEQFREIVDSVTFGSTGTPSWQLAEDWTETLEGGITYARLKKTGTAVDATVTQLSLPQNLELDDEAGWHDYVWGNVNRWRDQLSIQRQPWSAMQGELEEMEELSQGSNSAYFVSLTGTGSGSMSGGPFMQQQRAAAAAVTEGDTMGDTANDNTANNNTAGDSVSPHGGSEKRDSSPAAPQLTGQSDDEPLNYTTPDHWSEQPVSGMRRAAFSIEEGDSKAEVTVIASGGSTEAIVGMWLGQVSSPTDEATVKEVVDASEELEVGGKPAKLYFVGGGEQAEAILVADIAWKEGESLFVKLKGSSELVEAQRADFLEFLSSFSW